MKTRFLLSLACAAGLAVAVPATLHANGDNAARNVILGGVAGAIIGEHNNHRAAEGAAIGVAAGLLLTAITDDRDRSYYSEPRCRETVIVSRPYCPPRRVVVAPPCPPRRVVVVAPRHDEWHHRGHRSWTHYDDHREHRHDRRHDRRDNRAD
ncbi:MAG TPA: hypothetical protein VK178_08975 [Opitutaceae bacterium]|nr:hypothetical protein [Opitutaceae bacterium]